MVSHLRTAWSQRIAGQHIALRSYSMSDLASARTSFVEVSSPSSFSGHKLHIYCTDIGDVLSAYQRLIFDVEDRGWGMKLATQRFFDATAHGHKQAHKGVTIYLPRRAEVEDEIDWVVRLMEGWPVDGRIQGDTPKGNGVHHRFELDYDPEVDVDYDEYLRLYKPAKIAGVGTVTLYHGTNVIAAHRISYEGLKALDAHEFANQIEKEFGLPRDSVWNHPLNEFSRSARQGDKFIYLSGDRRTAESYASGLGSEILADALTCVYALQHPEWGRGYGDMGVQNWLDANKQKYRPALVTVFVPKDVLYHTHLKQHPGMPAGYDEFLEMFEEQPFNTVMLPSPIPASWVERVEVL